jgi:hypothetical protein
MDRWWDRMTLRSFAGWRGVVVGIAFVALGIWAFGYTCNTETAACKGAEPWPTLPGLLYRAGWVMAILGLVVIVASLAAWTDRVARTRSKK